MLPACRVRLCQDDPPPLACPAMGWGVSRRPRRCASSCSVAKAIPAARRQASPSRRASSPSGPWRAAGPQTASMALPRLVSSLAYFQRAISGIACELKVDAAKAAASASATSSVPWGQRPTSRRPRQRDRERLDHPRLEMARRAHHRDTVDWGNQRKVARSFSTPFCTQTTGVSDGAALQSACTAAPVS